LASFNPTILVGAKILAIIGAASLISGMHMAIQVVIALHIPSTSLDRQMRSFDRFMATVLMMMIAGLHFLLTGTAIVVTNGFSKELDLSIPNEGNFYLQLLGSLVVLPALEAMMMVYTKQSHRMAVGQ